MKLFTGKIKGHTYAITITQAADRVVHNRAGDELRSQVKEIYVLAADADGEVRFSFTDSVNSRWGVWTDEGLKRRVLSDLRREIEEV